MLTAKHISKLYGGHQILRGVNLSVSPGEVVAIIGPSGAGKSTLLRALAMIDPPDSGIVVVDDTTYEFPASRNGRPLPPWPKLCLVFQQLFLWPHLTIRENIALPLKKQLASNAYEKADVLIDQFAMKEFAGRYPSDVSIGQRQRAAIARAVGLNPRYLLLDEITSALDVEHVSELLRVLKQLSENGTGIVLVTHLIGFAKQAANQIVFVEDGGIVEQGGTTVLTAPRTERFKKFLSLADASAGTSETGYFDDARLDLEYVAGAIVEHLRRGNRPHEKDATLLDRLPVIDRLRQKIGDDDIPWLLAAVTQGSDRVAGLCCSLLRRYSETLAVKQCYEARWQTASPFLRNRILWRMLDDPNLPDAWHRRLFEFTVTEWSTFRDWNLTFYRDGKSALLDICNRLGDPSFPPSKKWAYLCSIPEVVDDPHAARGLITLGRSLEAPYAREVADTLLNRFWALPNSEGPSRAAQPVQEFSLRFVAEAIMARLRTGQKPSEQEAAVMNGVPFVDALREVVMPDDVRWILAALEHESGEVAGLFLSLLRNHANQEQVQEFLKAKWESATPFLRAHLLWRILDDPNLPDVWQKRIFEFMLEKWETFQSVSLKFLGNSETIVSAAQERYDDPSVPSTKKWAYLCRVASISSDPKSAKRFLKLGLKAEDEFARRVAAVLLDRFYPEDKP